MKSFDLAKFREAIATGRIDWRKHVLQKLAERGLPQRAVLQVLLSGDRIRDYTEDRPFPSALFMGYIDGKPLHVVVSFGEMNRRALIITAYEPSVDIFESDYRTKKKL